MHGLELDVQEARAPERRHLERTMQVMPEHSIRADLDRFGPGFGRRKWGLTFGSPRRRVPDGLSTSRHSLNVATRLPGSAGPYIPRQPVC